MNWGTDDSSLRVTNEQRDRVLDHINDAYAHGAIDDMERERRAETALLARTRCELDESYRNLPSFKPSVPEGSGHHCRTSRTRGLRRESGCAVCQLWLVVRLDRCRFRANGSRVMGAQQDQTPAGDPDRVLRLRGGLWYRPMGFGLNHRNAGFLSLIWTVVTIVQAVRGFKGQD